MKDGYSISKESLKRLSKMKLLSILYLADFDQSDDDCFFEMTSDGLFNLKSFSISSCTQLRNPDFVFLTSIENLEIRGCNIYSICGFQDSIHLTEVKIFFCEYLKDISDLYLISHQLDVIDFTGCKRINPSSFEKVILTLALTLALYSFL